MSDINTYANETAIAGLGSAINGDLVLNKADSSLYLCTNADTTGISRWKKFANDRAVASYSNQYALDLDGTDDYIDCGGDAAFSFTDGNGSDSAFSISAWVKLEENNRARVAGKGNMEWLFGTDSSNRFNMILWSNDGTSAYLQRFSSALPTGSWHHILCTYDGSNTSTGIKLYKAGSLVSSTVSNAGTYAGMASQQGALRLGQWEFNNSVMKGLMDEVAIFDYELTAPQVASLSSANNTQPVDISNLSITQPIGWYRMGDDTDRTGTSIKNAANPGTNDGTVVNGSDGNTTPNFVDLSTTSESVYVA